MNQDKKVVSALLEHYHKQFSLAILYDQLSTVVNDRGYTFLAKWVQELANDKVHTHRQIFLDYFDKAGIVITGTPKLFATNDSDFASVLSILKLVYTIEKNIRVEINELADLCLIQKDHEDFNFLQWYVADGLKDFGEIEQVVRILELGNNPINEDLAIAKYLDLKNSK